jgi:hypothetical protein
MRNHKEDDLQIDCITWIRLQYPDVVCFHAKNGGSLKSAREGARFKKMGVLAGTPDLFVMQPGQLIGLFAVIYHGLFIELKAGKAGKQSEAQKDFEQKAIAAGYAYHVVRSLDEFMDIVNNYLK